VWVGWLCFGSGLRGLVVALVMPAITPPLQTKPNQTKQTKPNQTKPNQTKPNQTKPNQTKPNQTKPNSGQHHTLQTNSATPRFPSFRALLSDLFPGVPVTDATNPQLEAALRASALDDMGLDITPQQVRQRLCWCFLAVECCAAPVTHIL